MLDPEGTISEKIYGNEQSITLMYNLGNCLLRLWYLFLNCRISAVKFVIIKLQKIGQYCFQGDRSVRYFR
jgi:hypothetical protein